MSTEKDKTIIGRAEKVTFPTLGGEILYARIDTGAKTSSIWATYARESPEGLIVRFAEPGHPVYEHEQLFPHYDRVRVASSMGHQQVRYKIKIPVIIRKRRILATFTLADRASQVYPVLVGRSTLMHKFIVDVSMGTPLRDAERERSEQLQANISEEHV